ncbi:UbiA family prenyltransferase [Candidatus Contubernalis alkaliaceticus]|uniref:UbiA family prenyltransferase n=1 Tax=Candidatus Contubernalis alkaliaceticus TaxID=338645 RepID=UPI001F4BF6D4|nr:UbiA family prenyltransferase [Candidatus Contubernalis alkalaceticus]UNC92001.1 UbiA family prenyltransferase [Candidatus Contubernalis alkalaceticus]
MINTQKVRGLIELIRPELPFAAGVSVIIGEVIALGSFPSFFDLIVGFLWGFFLSSPAMILNDYFDIEVDRINAPHRPLPSGLISPAEIIYLTVVTTLIGLAVSFFIGLSAVFLYIVFWLVGFLYNWKFKELGIAGNLMVSSSVAVTIILGSLVVGQPWNKVVWSISLMLFFFNLGEEIAADAMDMEGDKKRNVKSIAILIGKKNTLRLSALLFILVIILSFLPVFWNLLGTSYLIIISIMDLMILYFGIKLLKSQTTKEGRVYIRKLYLSALIGMLAIIISKLIVW